MGTATMTGSSQSATSPAAPATDFLHDVVAMADRIDRRLRTSLTPQQYAMVQDLVLATRITTIARDALDERDEQNVAA